MKRLFGQKNLQRCFGALICILHAALVPGQSCFEMRISTKPANTGDTIRLALTTRGFESITSYQFAVVWDPADLQFIKYDLSGTALDYQLFNPAYGSEGRLLTLWSDPGALGITLTDDAVLFEMEFKVLAATAGFYPVKINPDMAPAFEAIHENDQGSQKLPLAHTAGGARLGGTNDFAVSSLCVAPLPCNAPLGVINTDVSGGTAPYQYIWTGPNGFSSDESSPVNLIAGRYDLTATDATGAQVQAVVELPFAYSSIVVNAINTQNAVCSQPNGCVELSVNGGMAPYAFNWSVPGAAVEDRCDLPPGHHKVTVTDAVGCIQIAQIQVGNDSLLSLELDSINADCRFGQTGGINLYVNGTAPYSYHWSNGETNQNLTGISPGWYTVTVSDAAGCNAVSKIEVQDYGTFDWGLSLSPYCPENESFGNPPKITLRGFAMHERAEFPLTLTWNSGTMQRVQSVDEETVYQSIAQIAGMPAGPYAVTVTDAEGCSEQLSIQLNCYPVPPLVSDFGPRFYIKGEPYSSASVDSCIRISGENINELTEVGFSLKWQNYYMEFDKIVITNIVSGLSMDNFTVLNDRIDFNWEKNSFYYLHNTSTLFKVCFKNNIWYSKPWVEFTSGDAMPTVVHPDKGEMGFIGKGGQVYFEYDTDNETFCDMNLDPADCAAEGYARIRLHKKECWSNTPNNYKGISVYHNDNLYEGPERMLFAEPGEYRVYQNANYGESHLYAYIPSYELPDSECVWPGDADNNGVVNQFDMLYLGLGMGSLGTPRQGWLFWQGADAADWPLQTPLRQVNFKNLDTNGSGAVEMTDTFAILQHWGKAVNPYISNPFELPGTLSATNNDLFVSLSADTLPSGTLVEIPVYAGAPDIPATDLLGLTFSISFDTALLASGMRFKPSVSWLGNPGTSFICIQKDFPGQHRLDVALTRTNGTATGGYGEIGKLLLSFRQLSPGFLLPASLFVSNAFMLTPGEQLIAWRSNRTDFVIGEKESLGAGVPGNPGNSIRLVPNPASTLLRLESPDAAILRLEISTIAGSVVQAIDTQADSHTLEISCEHLPASPYWARIFTEDGLVVKKIVIAR